MNIKGKRVLSLFFAVFLFSGWFAAGLIAQEKTQEKAQDFTLVVVGDCIISNKISYFKDAPFVDLVNILRQADCTYGNCETTFFKPEDGFPAYKAFDPNVFCYPWGADEIKWLGIDLVSIANNHIMDFDYDGLFATLNHLDRVGINYAGAGKDLAQASRPGYFETAKGPVALVSCSSWLPEKNHQASKASAYMNGKPGLNPLNVTYTIQLDKENFALVKQLRDNVYKSLDFPLPPEEAGKEVTEINMEETKFSKGEKVDYLLVPNKQDLSRIIEEVKIAKRNARLVIVSLHEHNSAYPETAPTKFQEDFARSVIDAGADVFVGTGPHQLFGIELYKGKPIFYSIGNFLFQAPVRVIAPEAYERIGLLADTKDPTVYEDAFMKYFTGAENTVFKSVVPTITFDSDNNIKDIELHAITLDEKAPFFRRGTPKLADKNQTEAVFKSLNQMSARYKTQIIVEKGVAKVVKIN